MYAKTKALISCAVTAQLICAFVFAYANCWFSHYLSLVLSSLVVGRNEDKFVIKSASIPGVQYDYTGPDIEKTKLLMLCKSCKHESIKPLRKLPSLKGGVNHLRKTTLFRLNF